jgi:hypothetical protein
VFFSTYFLPPWGRGPGKPGSGGKLLFVNKTRLTSAKSDARCSLGLLLEKVSLGKAIAYSYVNFDEFSGNKYTAFLGLP